MDSLGLLPPQVLVACRLGLVPRPVAEGIADAWDATEGDGQHKDCLRTRLPLCIVGFILFLNITNRGSKVLDGTALEDVQVSFRMLLLNVGVQNVEDC